MNSDTALGFLIIAVLAVLGIYVIPRLRMQRATSQVIRIFRQHNATDAKSARTIDELGLRPRSFIDSMFRGRDFKPYAIQGLRKADIIRVTGDGKLYLSEETLAASGFEKR